MAGASPPEGWSGGDPADVVAWTLVRAFHGVGRRFYAALAPHGLTPQQFGVLIFLARHPGSSQAAVAREVLATPQSVGELLHGLASAGLVDRTPPAGRGRPASVRLSAEGRARLDRVTPGVLAAVAPAELGLDADEAGALNRLLHRVVERTVGPQEPPAGR